MSSERDIVFVSEIKGWDSGAAAEVTFYFGSQSFMTSPSDTPANTFIENRLTKAASLKRDLFNSGTTQGRSRSGFGDLVLLNPDGDIDYLDDYSFDGRLCIQKWGYLGDDYSTFTEMFRTSILESLVSEDKVTFRLRDIQEEMNAPFQPTKYLGTGGADGTADLIGKPIPVVIGNVQNTTPVLVDPVKLIYQVSDSAVQSILVYDEAIRLITNSGSWVSRVSGFGATTIRSVASDGAGTWVAVGDAGKLYTSTDGGVTWAVHTSGFGANNIQGVAYGNGWFVIVGDAGTIYRSSDGLTWVAATTPSFGATNIRAAAYGNGVWVAVAESGKIASSSDNGDHWTIRVNLGSGIFTAVAYGAGQFVAVTNASIGTVRTSPDGTTWTAHSHAVGALTANAIAYGNNVWVMFCDSNYVQTSVDAVVWTLRGQPQAFSSGSNLVSVVFGNGQFVGGDDGEGAIASSVDGIVWTKRRAAVANSTKTVGYGNGVFIAAGGTGALYTSATTIVYSTLADLQDNTLAPPAGGVGVYLAGASFRLGSSPIGAVTADVEQVDNTPTLAFQNIMARMGKVINVDYSGADLAALPLYEVGKYINEETTPGQLLDELANSYGAWWGNVQSGKYRTAVVDDPSAASPSLTFRKDDMVKPLIRQASTDEGKGLPAFSVLMQYRKNYTLQTDGIAAAAETDRISYIQKQWLTTTSTDNTVLTPHLLAKQIVRTTMLQDAGDAQTEGDRQLLIRKVKRDRYQFSVKLSPDLSGIGIGDDTFSLDYGAVIEIKHERYGLSAGKNFLVIGVEADYEQRELVVNVWG